MTLLSQANVRLVLRIVTTVPALALVYNVRKVLHWRRQVLVEDVQLAVLIASMIISLNALLVEVDLNWLIPHAFLARRTVLIVRVVSALNVFLDLASILQVDADLIASLPVPLVKMINQLSASHASVQLH